GLRTSSSPATNITGRIGKSPTLSMLSAPIWLRVLNTEAPDAQTATCSPPDVPCPITSSSPCRPIPSGLVQSIKILPERSPSFPTAVSVAGQGVARATTPALRAASGGVWSLSCGSKAYFKSTGSGTPNITSSPVRNQARPSADPTLPAPIIAIFIPSLFFESPLRESPLSDQPYARHPASRRGLALLPIRPVAPGLDRDHPPTISSRRKDHVRHRTEPAGQPVGRTGRAYPARASPGRGHRRPRSPGALRNTVAQRRRRRIRAGIPGYRGSQDKFCRRNQLAGASRRPR